MQIKCQCGKALSVPDSLAGKNVRCPGCKKVFAAPAAVTAQKAPAAAPKVVAAATKVTQVAPGSLKVTTPKMDDIFEDYDEPVATPKSSAPAPQPQGRVPQKDTFILAKQTCSYCGHPLPPSAQVCVECGTNLSTGTKLMSIDVDAISTERQEKSKKKKIVMVAVAILVVAIAATTFVVMKVMH